MKNQFKTYQAFIGLGSSIGNAVSIFDSAEVWLSQHGICIEQKSSLLRTKPFGGVAKNEFANAVWRVTLTEKTENQALHDLVRYVFQQLKACEVVHGRDLSADRWSDRPLDLDILMIGDLDRVFLLEDIELFSGYTLKTPQISIPHVGIPDRDFVLRPWKEITSDDFVIPGYGSLKNLLEMLESVKNK